MAQVRPSTPELYHLFPSDPGEDPKEAVRVLVQTRTHLLPGEDYYEKLNFMLDLISKHMWGRVVFTRRDRFHLYGGPFGCKNRRCYFLVDHGQARDDSTVPVLWYQFTGAGDPLKLMPHALPDSFLAKIREYPFTRPSKENRPKPPEKSDIDLRGEIHYSLRDEKPLNGREVTFLIKHSEHANWIKDNIEPRFWAKAESRLKARQDEDSAARVQPLQ